MNYGDKTVLYIVTNQNIENLLSPKDGVSVYIHSQGLRLNTASFIIGKYFLVVFKVLYRESMYVKTGYHLGRK